MTFSEEWEQRYKENTHISIWPWSDLVGFVMRHARPNGHDFRVLEIGCGAGANIPFFMSLGTQYHGIDGSITTIERLKEKFPVIKENLIVGDFTREMPFDGDFDLIVDRASLTSNPTKGIKQCLNLVYEKLKPGKKYIGIDWYSTLHSEYLKGNKAEDAYTRTGYQEGQFAHLGRVHFSDKPHIIDLFSKFSILVLEHKIIKREIPNENKILATWNFVAQKDK